MIVAALLLALAAGGEGLRWGADTDLQARGRSDSRSGQPTAQGGELALAGHLGLTLPDPDWVASLVWNPRVLLRQSLSGQLSGTGNSTGQAGMLSVEARATRTLRLGWTTSFDWGFTDFSPVSSPAPVVPALLPSQRFVRTLTLDSRLALEERFSRRLQLSATAGVVRSGGLGHDAVAVLPIQTGTVQTAALAFVTERGGTAGLLLEGAQSRFSLDRQSQLTGLSLTWSGQPTRLSRIDAAAGAAVIRSHGTDGTSVNAFASAVAGARWDIPLGRPERISAGLRALLSPTVDRISGLAVETLRGEASADLLGPRWHAALSASSGRSVDGAFAGTQDVRLEARAEWTLARQVAAVFDAATAWTNQVQIAGRQDQVYLGIRWSGAGVL